MKIIFFTSNQRGILSIKEIEKKYSIIKIITTSEYKKFIDKKLYIKCPKNINHTSFIKKINSYKPDVIISAGFNKIFSKNFIKLTNCLWLNLHAGELPNMRGSSPMNWALIKGHKYVKINVTKLNERIDSGDLIETKKIIIDKNTTIKNLHDSANKLFPGMLLSVLNKYSKNKLKFKKQSLTHSYYPKRFMTDGFILFDHNNAQDVHNKIRALADPYPNAFTYFNKTKIQLKKSILLKNTYHGEPGRIYMIKEKKILVCASDVCLWLITDHKFNQKDRYKKLATINEIALNIYDNKKK